MEYQDFKYIMSDMSKIYLGAEFTYGEACRHDFIPFKLAAVISQYLYKEVTPDWSIREHLQKLEADSLSYQTFKNLHVKLKMNIYSEVTDKKGNTKGKWLADRVLTLDQYLNEESYHLYPEHAIITELIVSKLHLMAFSL